MNHEEKITRITQTLNALCIAKGWSIDALAEYTEIEADRITSLLNGNEEADMEVFLACLEAFAVEPGDFFGMVVSQQ